MADQPTSMQGYPDETLSLDGFGAVVDYLLEHVPELVWPMSIDTYSRMRLEPQLVAIRLAYNLAVRRARWSIDPAGCRDEVVALVADDLALPVKGADDEPTGARRRKFRWAEHLRLALLAQDYGHMFFEQDYRQEGQRWRLNVVQERMPQTVAGLHLNPDGTLKNLEQKARVGAPGGPDAPKITTADHRLVYYVNDREGANYFGRSILRPAYPLWLIKDQVMRVHATSIKRFGLGILEVQAPPGATPQQIAEAQRYAGSIRASEHSGAGVPAGFTTALRGLQGQVPDAVGFLTYLDTMMARYTLTGLLNMASAERGNRSLGETLMDLMVYAQQSLADWYGEVGTDQIVVPLVDANWGEDEPAPRVCAGDVGADLELTAQDVNWLAQYWLNMPEPLQRFVLERYGVPTDDLESAVPPGGGGA